MSDELKRQRIKSMIEGAFFTDQARAANSLMWKWAAFGALLLLGLHMVIDLMS